MSLPSDKPHSTSPPSFDEDFRARLHDLVHWRRDVRRFLPDPIDETRVRDLIALACCSPSVGNSQPWRFVLVTEPARRQAVIASFERSNADALAGYDGETRALYARLKLEGLREAPLHLAVFADEATGAGRGLGQRTMPETLCYSVVGAIQTFWLAARAEGIGVGWISILEPDVVTKALDVPEDWTLVGYLCVGLPVEEHLDPELARHGWQERFAADRFIFRR